MMKRTLTYGIVAAVALGLSERAWAKLEIGEKAPPIKIKKWVKGQAIDPTNSGGKFVMLEFWATWCGPCKATMPHLSELQKKYESVGLVVVGVSREEVNVVEPFAKNASNKMEYTVAVDDRDDTWNKYMNGVGAMGIPYAFLVDRQGNLAWHGSPRDQHLEDLLTEIAKGTYDPERFAEKMRKVKRYEEYIELKAPQRALGLIDELIAYEPDKRMYYEADRFHCMMLDRTTRSQVAGQAPGLVGQLSDPVVLERLAWRMLTTEEAYQDKFDAVALQAAEKAYQMLPNDWKTMRTLAYAKYLNGDKKAAVDLQERAIKAADEPERAPLEKDLAWFRS